MKLEIPYPVRPMHIYMPGKTRFGKSTLMFWMALQDIKNGQGVCVMDAKGDLIDKLLKAIPKKRVDDAIFLSLDSPIALDFMSYRGEREKEALIGELQFLLTKSVEVQHAPLMNANIKDVLYTILNYNENPKTKPERRATFLDIYHFLETETRQKEILAGLTDRDLVNRWKSPKGEIMPHVERSRITSRMTPFVRSVSLQRIFGAPEPKLNIEQAFKDQRILLVSLGTDEIQSMYGTLLISKIKQAANRQAKLPEHDRIPFFLYCDEFQEFQTSDFDKMLSLAGGYGLCLTLAHQFVAQLEPRILASIKGNVSTFICFRLGAESANALREEIPPMETEQVWKRDPMTNEMQWHTRPLNFDAATLTRLPKFRVLYRAADGTAKFCTTRKPPIFKNDGYAEYIKKRTVEKYACNPPEKTHDVVSTFHDDIPPSGEPNVPPYKGKEKDT